MEYKYIDVSRYQDKIDWQAVKNAGIQGAILKTVSTNASFGGLYIDPFFGYNYRECKRLGIPVGVYYYTYALDRGYADKELALLNLLTISCRINKLHNSSLVVRSVLHSSHYTSTICICNHKLNMRNARHPINSVL